MNEDELRQLLNGLVEEVRTLRLEVIKLKNVSRDSYLNGQFLTLKEACGYLKISRTTMQKRLSDGDICFAVKRGKSWLFPEEKLKAYAEGL